MTTTPDTISAMPTKAGSNYHASVTNLRHGGAQHETAARWFARRLIGVAPI
uniref:hypothetical protein n=1 Tax=Rhizobium lupini TaxID=136996 RepID=UPI003F650CF4